MGGGKGKEGRLCGGGYYMQNGDVPYDVRFAPAAERHLHGLTAREQRLVVDSVEVHLRHQPDVPTRNRKRLRPNPVAGWELRIGDLRVYYDFMEPMVVVVLAVGVKVGNVVLVEGHEVRL